jgi:hypothetical protein
MCASKTGLNSLPNGKLRYASVNVVRLIQKVSPGAHIRPKENVFPMKKVENISVLSHVAQVCRDFNPFLGKGWSLYLMHFV